MKKSQRQIRKEYKEKGIKTGKERYNIGVTILLILGLNPLFFIFFSDLSLRFFHNCSSFLPRKRICNTDITTITIKNTTAFALWNPNCPPLIPLL